MSKLYCNNLTRRERWNTREVMIGNVGVGGNNPIRVQSMITTDTMDTDKSVRQSMRLIDAGCEIVRITAPSIKEAKNLENIRKGLRRNGYNAPIVADIHFTPKAAEVAAKVVEKVRINPGNYVDRKKFEIIEYSNSSYNNELERIRDRFIPLLYVCKEYGTAMRIGTNHGSLSDRILSRYGDTPNGMVESAMEFLRIAEDEGFYDIILSMKSSNTQVMVQAYRMLVNRMIQEKMNYPLHLGLTEAGEGEDGRIKSSLGIGTLLHDGLGDTIRVSLTEEPEAEIPVANILVSRYNKEEDYEIKQNEINTLPYDPFFYTRRETRKILNIGSNQVPRVVIDMSHKRTIHYEDLAQYGYLYSPKLDKWHVSDVSADFIYVGNSNLDFEFPGTLGVIENESIFTAKKGHYPLFNIDTIDQIPLNEITFIILDKIDSKISKLENLPNCIIILNQNRISQFHRQRLDIIELINHKIMNPVILRRSYPKISKETCLIYTSTDFGGLQIDGLGDGIWIDSNHSGGFNNQLSFGILQASRTRISKTEYISCPSCGRTLFDLQETTAKIRKRTDHLKGVKIGIMGCIVNGPGEMADADYGYVGTGKGLISLYKGQQVVLKNIPSANAVQALIELIQSNGDWTEPNNL